MPAPSGQIPPPGAWWENEAPAARAACRSSQAAVLVVWLPGGEEQVAVKAEEIPSLTSELVEVGQPGVGLLPGELATSDGEVGHDLAVGDAVGVGAVVGVEQHQHLRLVDLEAGSAKLAGERAG